MRAAFVSVEQLGCLPRVLPTPARGRASSGQSAVQAPLNTRRYLGHPSVGGRLTAGATGRRSQGTAVLHVRASVQVGCSVPAEAHIRSVGLRACRRRACAASISRANSRNENARIRWRLSRQSSSLSWPLAQQLPNPACRHLTYRSSGRAKARCARVSPPLTSTLGPGKRRTLHAAADPSFVSVPASGAVGTNASKGPCRSQGNRACRLAVALAASPGPPVRRRSAHCRCSGRHLSSHGRPEAPSVSAGNCMESSRAIGRIGLRFAWPSREVVRPELGGHTA